LVVIVRGNSYRNHLVNEAIAFARNQVEGMLGARFALQDGTLFQFISLTSQALCQSLCVMPGLTLPFANRVHLLHPFPLDIQT
jgi:hypothetical protein